jgi:hypothetical protein
MPSAAQQVVELSIGGMTCARDLELLGASPELGRFAACVAPGG